MKTMQHNTLVNIEISEITVMHAITTFQRVALQGLSPETKRWYRCRLSLIAGALGETQRLYKVLDIDLIRLREKWEKQNLSPDTLHGYIRAMRRLFRWLFQRGLVTIDLVQDIPLPKLPKRGRRGISDENAMLIMESARQRSVRDYAMLRVFASTSARRGGVAGLKLQDLRTHEQEPYCRQIQVVEKGGKQRTVIMDNETLRALKAWLEIRPSGSEYVFVSNAGKPLNANSISEVIDRYKQRLGIAGPCSPHQWRHRWFRRVLSNRMPLTQAAQLGGHENTAITYQFYGQFAVDELQEAYDKYHPPPMQKPFKPLVESSNLSALTCSFTKSIQLERCKMTFLFGRVVIDTKTITVQYKAFDGQPTTITSEEETGVGSGEFLFGLSVQPDDHVLSVYETKPIDGINMTELPVVEKYMHLIADSVRMLDKLKA